MWQERVDRRKFLKIGGGIILATALGGCSESINEDNTLTVSSQQVNEPTENNFIPGATNIPKDTATPFPTKTPEMPRLSVEMARLRESLIEEIENYQGMSAISITDVVSNETININGERAQLDGCVANLPAALTVVEQLEEGDASYTKDEIESSLTTMVRHSDPVEGKKVIEKIGDGNVKKGLLEINKNMQEWGMSHSYIDHPPAYWGYSNYTLSGDDNSMASGDMNRVLARLAVNELFQSNESNEYAKWVMSDNKVGLNFMIPGEIPASEATVVHKVGWFYGIPNTINDAGIVEANDGRFTYSIVAMYENFDTFIAENPLFYGPGFFLRKLSKITYDTFVTKYGRPE